MDVLLNTEDIVLEYLDSLSLETQKAIQLEQDIISTFTHDAEQEMKDALWDLVRWNLNYSSVLEKLKEKLGDLDTDDESVSDTESEEEDEELEEEQEDPN